jgi:hypothetical protein
MGTKERRTPVRRPLWFAGPYLASGENRLKKTGKKFKRDFEIFFKGRTILEVQ